MGKLFAIFALLFPALALGQYTAVSAHVVDANGSVYQNCSFNAIFVGQSSQPGPYLISGSVFQQSVDGLRCNSSGNISLRVATNSFVSPTPSQWQFNFCDQTGKYCGQAQLTISGAAQDISTALTAVAPILPIGGVAYNTIQDDGVGLTQRQTLNMTGAGVTCTDGAGKTNCDIPGGGGGGDIISNPGTTQTITQPKASSFNVNRINQVRYAAQFNWVQTPPSGTVSIGANVTTINGVMGVAAASVTPFKHYLWIAGTGTPERVLITATTCTGVATGTCTVSYTAAGTHGAGFTIGSATAGAQEAFVDAFPVSSGSNPMTGVTVMLSPTNDLSQVPTFNAPLSLDWSHGSESPFILDGQGAAIKCNTSGLACIEYGNSTTTGVYSFPRLGIIRNLAIAPVSGMGHTDNGSTVAIHDHGQELTIDHVGFTFINSTDVFDYLIVVDDDEKFTLRDSSFNTGNGPPLRCTTTWCGVGLYGTPLNGGAVGYAIHDDMSMQCLGNPVDWQSGNTFSIRDSVVQAFPQWGVRAVGAFDVNLAAKIDNVYQEVGNCTNPLGTGTAGLICRGGYCTKAGGVGPSGKFPTLTASSPGSTLFYYYIIPKSSTLGTGAPLLLGRCSSSGAGTCPVKWYAVGSTGTITYDVVRVVGDGAQPGPYTAICTGGSVSACGSVALAQAQGTVCSGGTCSITDDITANTTSYTVATATYFPKIDQWSSDIVLSASSDTNNVHNGATEYIADTFGGANNSVASTAGANGPTLFFQRCNTGMQTGAAVMSCVSGDPSQGGAAGTSAIIPEIHFNGSAINAKGLWLGTLGNVTTLAATDLVTVLDSNFAKTTAGGSLRPLADTADCAIGLDNATALSPANSFMGIRCGAGIDFLVNSLLDGVSWKLRIAPTTISTPIQIVSSLATGTAPFTITSTTPVANLTAVPTTYNHSGTQQTGTHVVADVCTLGTSCSVTLTGAAVFTNSTSYQCHATDKTAAAAVQFSPSSGSAFALTGTGTDVLSYVCVGN